MRQVTPVSATRQTMLPDGIWKSWYRAVSTAAPAVAAESTPTAETLEPWLVGKEIVSVTFAGPHVEMARLRAFLTARGDYNIDAAETRRTFFYCCSGEGGGVNRAFVTVRMKTTPENVERLLSLQKALREEFGYHLDPEWGWTDFLSYTGDEETRRKARDMVPDLVAAATKTIQEILPKAEIRPFGTNYRGSRGALDGIRFEELYAKMYGDIFVHEITALRNWETSMLPRETIHLPHLGLIVTTHVRFAKPGGDESESPECTAVLQAVKQAMQPLIDLDGDPWIYTGWPEDPATRTTPPTTAPASAPAAATAATSTPTAETLEQWLDGKEFVAVVFGTSYKELDPLRAWLEEKGHLAWDHGPAYLCYPGQGGGWGVHVDVEMNATPANVERLRALMKDLAELGGPDADGPDVKAAYVWSYVGDAETRRKAREMVPKLLTASAKAIKDKVPQAKANVVDAQPGFVLSGKEVRFSVPKLDMSGLLLIHEITLTSDSLMAAIPDMTIHLPHLGLAVWVAYEQQHETEPAMSRCAAIREAIRQALQPLIDLDGDPWGDTWPTAIASAATSKPATITLEQLWRKDTAEPPPTADTLEQWLADKDVVSLAFAGPQVDRDELKAWLEARGDYLYYADTTTTFRCFSGTTGVIVQMKVTPDKIGRAHV